MSNVTPSVSTALGAREGVRTSNDNVVSASRNLKASD
jgi:hypothetical protein